MNDFNFEPLEPKPRFQLSDRANNIAKWTILVLAVLGILAAVYIQIAIAKDWWPYG